MFFLADCYKVQGFYLFYKIGHLFAACLRINEEAILIFLFEIKVFQSLFMNVSLSIEEKWRRKAKYKAATVTRSWVRQFLTDTSPANPTQPLPLSPTQITLPVFTTEVVLWATETVARPKVKNLS